MNEPRVNIIAALGDSRVLGRDNELLWRIPDDLKRFKELTSGHPIIMGRKTFESIGRPLPLRENIVITRDPVWGADGVHVMHSLEKALELATSLDNSDVFVIGGAQIYEQALPFVDRLCLTLIQDDKEGDAYFPVYEHLFPRETFREERMSPDGIRYTWVNLERS